MDLMPTVRSFAAGDEPAAVAIIESLPDYFTDDVPEKLRHDAGVVVAARKPPGNPAAIYVAALRPTR
jgi:hypothetical protein